MFEQESVVPLGCLLANHGNVFKSDRGVAGETGSDLARPGCLPIGSAEPPVIAGGEAEVSEAEDQAGDEGDDARVDGGHQAG